LGKSPVKLRIRIVPSILGECAEDMATPFLDAVRPQAGKGYDLGQFGFEVAAFRVAGRSSSHNNAEEIRSQIAAMNLKPDERLVQIGHSKGMSDLAVLIGGDHSVVSPGSSVVSPAGVVAGTPIAGQGEGPYEVLRKLHLPNLSAGDGSGVASLMRRTRLNCLAEHPLPGDLHYFSIATCTRRGDVSSGLRPTHAALSRVDARNGGNVIFTDSIIPGSTVLRYLDADHWAVAMPFEIYPPTRRRVFESHTHFPRVVLL
jgi:hypothetical protein